MQQLDQQQQVVLTPSPQLSSTSSAQQNSITFSQSEAFSRNIGLLTLEEQERVHSTTIAIPGCGGVGGGYALTLARAGFCSFKLADHDQYEVVNFNRQNGANMKTVGRNKATVIAEMILDINPLAKVKTYTDGINKENIDDFLNGVDLAMDCLDFFVINMRRLLFNTAHAKRITVFSAAPVGWSCAWEIFLPDGPSLDQFCGMTDDMSEEELMIRHIVSVAPAGTHLKYMKPKNVDFTNHAVPSLGPVLAMAHGIMSCEVLNYVTKKRPVKGVPHYYQFDVMTLKYKTGYLRWGNSNPIQRIKIWYVNRLLEKGKKMRLEQEKSEKSEKPEQPLVE